MGLLTDGFATTCILNISAIERLDHHHHQSSMLAICMVIASILHLLDLWTEHPADEDLAFERVDEDPADHGCSGACFVSMCVVVVAA